MALAESGPSGAFHNSTWIASHAHPLNSVLLDTNNNIQLVITAGTSRTAAQGHPAWTVAVKGVTTDNTVKMAQPWIVATARARLRLAASGGTSGIIIDNTVGTGTMVGASQVYFRRKAIRLAEPAVQVGAPYRCRSRH